MIIPPNITHIESEHFFWFMAIHPILKINGNSCQGDVALTWTQPTSRYLRLYSWRTVDNF